MRLRAVEQDFHDAYNSMKSLENISAAEIEDARERIAALKTMLKSVTNKSISAR